MSYEEAYEYAGYSTRNNEFAIAQTYRDYEGEYDPDA